MNQTPNDLELQPKTPSNEVDRIIGIIKKAVTEGRITPENFFKVTENYRTVLLTDFQRENDIENPVEDPSEIVTDEDLIRFESELKAIQNELGVKNPEA